MCDDKDGDPEDSDTEEDGEPEEEPEEDDEPEEEDGEAEEEDHLSDGFNGFNSLRLSASHCSARASVRIRCALLSLIFCSLTANWSLG